MRLHIVAVGHRMPSWVKEGVGEFLRRVPREFACTLTEIKPEARSGKEVRRLLVAEAARIEAALPAGAIRVILDQHADAMTTLQLAEKLRHWMLAERDIAFIIGSADGLDAALKQTAHLQLALSAFTLPHALARVVLAEQIYRALSLLKNHPYHRE